VFGFVDRGMRRPPIKLPDNARVCFTVDIAFEGFEKACQYRGRPMPPERPDLYSLSFAEYGLRIGVWRLLELIDEFKVTAGCLTNGYAAQRYPKTLKAVHDAGHEIVAHGWTNDAGIASLDVDTERAEVKRTLDAIVAAVGEPPVGWLSPGYSGSPARLQALTEAGIFYSCDDAADDLPYVIRIDGKPHAILPRTSFGSNDLDNWFGPKLPASAFLDSFRSQFDSIYDEAIRGRPGWIELVLHAHFAGRPQAMREIRDMMRYVLGQPGIWVAPRRDLARWVLDHPDYHGV
jgi:peptidoglycan/xylan/chitin deacetylase (PgdA/CDA1 family)